MSDAMMILVIVLFVLLILLCGSLSTWWVIRAITRTAKIRKTLNKSGYEALNSAGLWMKGNTLYAVHVGKGRMAAPEITPAEVIGISEVRSGSQLVQLEIQYSVNGSAAVVRIKGAASWLRAIAGRLGYSKQG